MIGMSLISDAIRGTWTGSFDGYTPSHTILDVGDVRNTSIPNTNLGALNSSGAARFALDASWGNSGKTAYILLGRNKLSQYNAPSLRYWYAYSDGMTNGTFTYNCSRGFY